MWVHKKEKSKELFVCELWERMHSARDSRKRGMHGVHNDTFLKYSKILFILILRNHIPVTYHKFSFLAVSSLYI